MVHLRVVVANASCPQVLQVLEGCPSVINVVLLEGAARKPPGDVIFCDVASEDASVVIADLKALEVHIAGSISVSNVDTAISRAADEAERHAPGSPFDAVIWEDVTARTSESSTISGGFVVFMILATMIAAVGIFLDSPILVVGAMVVGPEFGPLAGVCVALIERRGGLAARSLGALALGFPLAIALTTGAALAFKATGVTPSAFTSADHDLARSIANPDFLAFFVAFCAGVAGMLSLTTAKSGALIGVLISVTTIPAAANIAVAAAYGDWSAFRGSVGQLGLNMGAIVIAGTATLGVQRLLYRRRRTHHKQALQSSVGAEASRGREPTSTVLQ